jgi:hypothetical protein
MNLDDVLYKKLMQALLGKGGNPRSIFRIMVQVKRNQIFWELKNDIHSSYLDNRSGWSSP